jgi:hypothetical protein
LEKNLNFIIEHTCIGISHWTASITPTMDDKLGDGITRSTNGRRTYSPDGLGTPSSQNPQCRESTVVPNIGDFEKETKNMSDDKSFLGEEEDDDSKGSLTSPSSSMISRHVGAHPEQHQPSGSEASNSERDIEKQELQSARTKKEEKDPNLVEWDGPDDPVGNP